MDSPYCDAVVRAAAGLLPTVLIVLALVSAAPAAESPVEPTPEVVRMAAPLLESPRPTVRAWAWRRVKVVEGIELRQATAEDGRIWGLADAEIDAPIDRVIAHLVDFGSLSRHVPRLATSRVLRQSAGEAMVYFRLNLPWPLSDREWTARYVYARERSGEFRMLWTDANDLGPSAAGLVRVSPVRGAWLLKSTPTGTTRAQFVFLSELGGHLPRVVVEQTAWRQPLGTLEGVRRAVTLPER